MRQYQDLLSHVINNGVVKEDRTGTGTRSVFGYQMRFNLSDGFPMLTTKKLHLKSIIHELLWFLQGDTNIRYLQENGVKIWDEWADENGDLGPVYGKQWRSWAAPNGQNIDQISNLIHNLKTNPFSRRHVISAWNPADVNDMALPPCHCLFQFNVREATLKERQAIHLRGIKKSGPVEPACPEFYDAKKIPRLVLDCQLYQRSADIFLGVPFNIASYALLTMMVAQVCDMIPGDFVHTFGDAHLYSNHLDQANIQIARDPRSLPAMKINPAVKDIFSFKFADFELTGYDPHPHIAAKVAV